MREILRYTWVPDYAQIALTDMEGPDAIPAVMTGEEAYVLGSKGVLVATARSNGNSDPVEVTVYEGPGIAPGIFLVSTTIDVGSKGLFVGDPIYPSPPLSWLPGLAKVSVYVDAISQYPEGNIRHVAFVLEHIN